MLRKKSSGKKIGFVLSFLFILSAAMTGTLEINANYSIPEADNIIYSDDFSGTEFNGRIVSTVTNSSGAATGSVKLSSGEIEIAKNTSNSNWAGIDIYLNEDKSAVTGGEFVTQFKLRRYSSKPTIQVRMRSSGSKDYTGLSWGNGGTVSSGLYYSDVKDTADGGSVTSAAFGAETELVVSVYYNLSEQTFTMWLNGAMVLHDKYPRHGEAADMSYIRIYSEYKGAKFYVDDFKYYVPVSYTDDERVQMDCDALTHDNIFSGYLSLSGTVNADISLPSVGKYGSSITWTSSDISLIKNNGEVSLADSVCQTNPEVTLTATVMSGEAAKQKEFTLKVMKENEYLPDKPGIKKIIYSNDFSADAPDSHFSLTENGGVIGINDHALNITRSENTGTTIADLYPDSEQKPLTGLIGVSYTVRKYGTGKYQDRIRQQGFVDFAGISWSADNTVSCKASDSADGTSGYYSYGTYNNELRVNYIFDTSNGTFCLWLNEKPVLEDKHCSAAPGDMITYLRFFLESNDLITVTVDDVKIYNVAEIEVIGHSRLIDGETAENLPGSKTVDTAVTVRRSNAGNALVFSALFSSADGIKKLESVIYEELVFTQRGELTSDTLSVNLPDNTEGYTLETFVFNSWNDIAPAEWIADNTPLVPSDEN